MGQLMQYMMGQRSASEVHAPMLQLSSRQPPSTMLAICDKPRVSETPGCLQGDLADMQADIRRTMEETERKKKEEG